MRVLSLMRPTGQLHLGHLHGALANWIRLQGEGEECFFGVADWHALTTDWQTTAGIPQHTREMVVDWLAAGLDPATSTFFIQSQIKEHAELNLLLGMITPLGWLERNPTYKELREELKEKDLSNLGFLGYPVLQAADILLYKGEAVPVGQDQLPHLELTREITRRFNNTYGHVFPEPQPRLTPSPKIMGTDGKKMSKSYGNAILLADEEKTVRKKIQGMVTDPKRARRQDPGDPDTCNFYPLHQIYSSPQTMEDVRQGCVSAGIGCVDCKNMLYPSLFAELKGIRERRQEYLAKPDKVTAILHEGTSRARQEAGRTMSLVREAVHLVHT